MPESNPRGNYRDELTTAYARIAELEARNQALEAARTHPTDADVVPAEHVRELDARLRRWDRVRAALATMLGLTGLFALLIAERWDVRTALLAACSAMVAVGITLAWPQIVRAPVDPKPYATDVSRRWRRTGRRRRVAPRPEGATTSSSVRVEVGRDAAPERELAEAPSREQLERRARPR